MKKKILTVLLCTALASAGALYGQQSSNVYQNTMSIFKTDVDKLQDVNDYAEVDINKAYLMAGSRYESDSNSIRGIQGGFATYKNDLYIGIFYDGYFWNGNSTEQGSTKNSTITYNNQFSFLFGKESFGGIGITLGLNDLQFGENKAGGTTTNTRSGLINIGAEWGKNFAYKGGTLKPDLGFLWGINMNETSSGSSTGGHGPSILALMLTTEYLYPKEGQHQTTLSFGDVPVFFFAYDTNNQSPKDHREGRIYNTLYGELKQVYEITGNLSLGYLAGLSLIMNSPSDNKDINVFEFGFLPRLSAALTYKASEKFLFNTGVRLGAMEPENTSNYAPSANYNPFNNMNDNFGIFYQSVDPSSGSKQDNWRNLQFVGAWGLGMLWQPEKAFSGDFSVSSQFMPNRTLTAVAPAVVLANGNLNFSVLFTLNL